MRYPTCNKLLLKSIESLLLYNGKTCVILSSQRNTPSVRDKFVIYVSGVAKVSIIGLIHLENIPSCPGALFLIFNIIFRISRSSVGVRKIHFLLASGKYLWNEGPGVGICAAKVLPTLTK